MDDGQREKTACFTGHRVIAAADRERLAEALAQCIEEATARGVVEFAAGGALGFDTMAAEAVLAQRQRNPAVRLRLILPCADQDARWSSADSRRYRRILEQADQVEYIAERYFPGCMQTRNRRLVDLSSLCIGYCRKAAGGTAYTLRYAEQSGIEIFLL